MDSYSTHHTIKDSPYVGFPIIKSCGFSCTYCTAGGEAGASTIAVADRKLIAETAKMAYELGTRKFRVTGGEPFMHKDLGNILYDLAKFSDATTTVNTTGIPLIDRQGILTNTPKNVSFIISLDSADPEIFKKIRPSRIPNVFEKTLESIQELSNRGILKRLNMVVSKDNSDGVFDLVNLCKKFQCDLKVADIADNNDQFQPMGEIYSAIDKIESQLAAAASKILEHRYTNEYGIPSKIYTVDGVNITVKNSKNGTKYNMSEDQCGSCLHYPCSEGLYFVSALADGSFSNCRRDGIHIAHQDRKIALKSAMDVIRDAKLQSNVNNPEENKVIWIADTTKPTNR